MFVEASPHPVLLAGIEEVVAHGGGQAVVVPTLGRDEGGLGRFWLSVGRLLRAGVGVDWAAVFAGVGARRVGLPTYAFQRRRYWLASGGGVGDVGSVGLGRGEHALLGAVVARPDTGGVVLTGRLSVRVSRGWLIMRWLGWCCFPGRGLWSWRSGPGTRSGARWCRS